MEQLNVLVVSKLTEESKRLIKSVSPRINLLDTSHLWDAPRKVTSPQAPLDFSSPDFEAILGEAEIIFGFRPPKNVTKRAPRLKWIQGMLAGVDFWLDEPIVQSPIIVTNMRGLYTVPVAETALEMILLFAKHAPVFERQKLERKWQRVTPEVMRGKTIGIVGLGTIGKELARMVKVLGVRVIATRRKTRKAGRGHNVDLLLPAAHLPQLLEESDYVVLTLPATPETNKIIGEKALKAMKPTAVLINVGRGETVDDEALIKALKENKIGGAALDTFITEPLPPNSEYWELPNVFISPHISGVINYQERGATEIFCDNLKRYIEGKKLRNIINKKLGY